METVEEKGLSLLKARKMRRMTQQNLADEFGVDIKTIRNWEKGTVSIPAVRMKKVDDFINGTPEASDEPRPVKSFTHGVPYYDVDFRLGFDLMMNDQTARPDYLIDFAPYNKCDVWCNARGDSMAPTIANGDIIALKEIADPSFLANDEIYAVVTTNDMRTIKRVRDEGDSLLLIPDNKAYSDQRLPKTLIGKVYKVVGCMKMF